VHASPRDSGIWRAIAIHAHRYRTLWAYGLLCVLAFVAYGGSLGGFFLADDFPLISKHHHRPLEALGEFVRSAETSEGETKYRPIWNLSLVVDGLIWGVIPFGYRLTNLLLHLGCVWLLYRFCEKATRSPGYALVTAAAFCCFPSNYEGVMWIAARQEPLSLLFQLLTLNMFLTASGELAPTRTHWWAMVPAALAFLSKESAFVLPVTIMVLVWLRGSSKGWRAVWDAIRACLPVLLVFAACLVTRHLLLGSLTGGRSLASGSGFFTFLEQRYALVQLLVAPVRVVAHSMLMFQAVEVLSLITLLLGAIACVFRGHRARSWLTFCLLWFLLAQGPLLFVNTDPLQHWDVRYAYGPAAAYSALMVHAMFALLARARAGTALTTVLASALIALCLYLLAGNQDAQVRAGRMVREVQQRGLEILQQQPEQPTVLMDLPARLENAWSCLNAGQHMFQPPFTVQPSVSLGFSDSDRGYEILASFFKVLLSGLDADYYRFDRESGRFIQCAPPTLACRTGTVARSEPDGKITLDGTRLLLLTGPGSRYLGQRVRVEALLVDSIRGPLIVAFKVDNAPGQGPSLNDR